MMAIGLDWNGIEPNETHGRTTEICSEPTDDLWGSFQDFALSPLTAWGSFRDLV